jgi:hypothetical protein
LWILLESKAPRPETRKKQTMKKCPLALRLLAAPTLAQALAQEQAEIALHGAGSSQVQFRGDGRQARKEGTRWNLEEIDPA